jgi:biopolymer transport protein ExbD
VRTLKKSSKSHHHALAELNITPLLDLAFVLLVIFIITTTPIVNDLEVDLPNAARRQKDPKAKVNYVTVESSGKIFLNKEEVQMASLQEKLVGLRLSDPDLTVTIRGSSKTKYVHIRSVMDTLQQANVAKVNLATEPVADGAAMRN